VVDVNLSVIGTGYLGAVHAACMARIGHHVLGIDKDSAKISELSAGIPPFFEPGFAQLLASMVKAGRLRFGTSLSEAAAFSRVHFLSVGTPQREGSLSADTSHLESVVTDLAPFLREPCLVVGRSTVPVGTAEQLSNRLAALAPAGCGADVAWNPEFLREGHAVRDTLAPDRIVAGVTSGSAADMLRRIYEPILRTGVPYITTDRGTAELAKMAANAFLATKISFINAMADLCDAAGADVTALTRILGHDPRIGDGALSAGLGYGGGCLPKDVRALIARADELEVGKSLRFLREVDEVNSARRSRVLEIASELLGMDFRGVNAAVLGAAFKPGTDDVRESPALAVAGSLKALGAQVRIHDPRAAGNAQAAHPELDFCPDVEKTCGDADIVLHLTDWPVYRELDPARLYAVVKFPRIVDARNSLAVSQWRAAGWVIRGIGIPSGKLDPASRGRATFNGRPDPCPG
jgi:UDPglucose 6-dehydrogenase